ncbi:GNAT family N-acetyltransferase [Kribbella antibiotica]|uniref:GNAT family N-acetyltransferase n=1 Tax=Kribbella antibiotica TaxID=190195 RepID=A0A4V2YPV9_9ACTN|nr:GNAT family N-acetyltransferase [Kribbella antibiotica]TDD59617.1 GNAT family N-acetyltransferase [Kribbella antibiotica]
MNDLHLANKNGAAFWRALGRARGYEQIERPSFIAALDPLRNGLRVVLTSPEPPQADLAELTDLLTGRPWPRVTIEDPYGVVSPPLMPARWPVMIRPAAPVPAPTVEVVHVQTEEQLAAVDRVVVEGFPLPHFQPYGSAAAIPPGLLATPGFDAYLIAVDGQWAAAGATITQDDVSGVYFVTTMPEFRGQGLARQLMYAVLAQLDPLPVTLTAAAPAQHLYQSLGFTTIAESTWWSS